MNLNKARNSVPTSHCKSTTLKRPTG